MSRLLLGENLVIRHGYLVRVQDPITPAVIEIEGASRGMGIMHLLGEGDPDKVKIGKKVEAVWKPSEGGAGSILDIAHFGPAEMWEEATGWFSCYRWRCLWFSIHWWRDRRTHWSRCGGVGFGR